MSNIPFEFSTELVEIGLVAWADPTFGERLLEALNRLPEPDRAGGDAADKATSGTDLGAAA